MEEQTWGKRDSCWNGSFVGIYIFGGSAGIPVLSLDLLLIFVIVILKKDGEERGEKKLLSLVR